MRYRHEWIAHIAKTKGDPGHYDDLFSATDRIEELTKKYKMLLTAGHLSSMTPVIQGNWQEVLRSAPLVDND